MKYLVQKFGGTSLINQELRGQVAEKVIAAKKDGFSPVVVVSAIGRHGDPYATDTLLEFVEQISNEVSAREIDTLMSCGEIISGIAMVATLKGKGYKAVFLTGGQAGIITDEAFSDARILEVNPSLIHQFAEEDYIVVVAGFQGISKKGDTTTLGRGGSDTTGAALGVALNAEAIEIYTDVEGIMTADPRIVQEARTLDTVTYNEIVHMAQDGAKVIHPRAVEIAMQKNIPLRVKCTFSDAPGTLVANLAQRGPIEIKKDKVVTGIAHIPDISQLKIDISLYEDEEEAPLRIFKAMSLTGISVDFINVSPEAVVFTVKTDICSKAVEILENMGFQVEIVPGCAKVSAVGAGMAGVPGVMASIVEALTEEKIRILQTADSHVTIWCLVNQLDMEKAIRALHKKFRLDE